MGSGREMEFMKRGVRRRRRRQRKHIPRPIAVMTIPIARKTPATALLSAKNLREHPCVSQMAPGQMHGTLPRLPRILRDAPNSRRVRNNMRDADELAV